jgi:hypothetical protein
VIRTSNSAAAGKMNPQLVPLLEHAGRPHGHRFGLTRMDSLLLALHQAQVESVLELLAGKLTANRLRHLLTELGMSDASSARTMPADMLLAGFDPLHEPFLRAKVARIVKQALERVASGRFRLPSSLCLTGVPLFLPAVSLTPTS